MDLIDKIRELSARIPKQLDSIQTEEATKHALVMPFLHALGYNVFDPSEVTPELNADFGTKKGEKIDYAILKDGKPIILIECKHYSTDLGKVHASQLYRYYSVTEARFGVLTNGLLYWFYADLDEPNKMDKKPFFEFNVLDAKENAVEELKKFSKSSFDLSTILSTAAELKYTREITRLLSEQMQEPSEEFVRFFASKVYSGRMTQPIREQFTQLTKRAFRLLLNDQINDRLKSVLSPEAQTTPNATPQIAASTTNNKEIPAATETESAIITTEEEIEAYNIIRAILREHISPKRVAMRDVQSYCGILLDDNNRKPICRLYFNGSRKSVGFFDTEKEEGSVINELEDLFAFAGRFKSAVDKYDSKSKKISPTV
ncbi:restriction endonuclease [bacterium]|nr:MAG: restriction endonuclease [bacterium]